MERSYTDLAWHEKETEVRLEIPEPGFEFRPIIQTAPASGRSAASTSSRPWAPST